MKLSQRIFLAMVLTAITTLLIISIPSAGIAGPPFGVIALFTGIASLINWYEVIGEIF